MLTNLSSQAWMRLFCSLMSWRYTTAGGYRGMSDSDSSTKRSFRGSSSANSMRSRIAFVMACVPQCVCDSSGVVRNCHATAPFSAAQTCCSHSCKGAHIHSKMACILHCLCINLQCLHSVACI